MFKGGMKLNESVCSDFLGIWPWWLLNTIRDFVFAPISRLVEYFVEPPSGESLIAITTQD